MPWGPMYIMARKHLADKTPCAIAYHGNVVDLLEYLYEKEVFLMSRYCIQFWHTCPVSP